MCVFVRVCHMHAIVVPRQGSVEGSLFLEIRYVIQDLVHGSVDAPEAGGKSHGGTSLADLHSR